MAAFDLDPILVTGAPRSGTTFVGGVIGTAPGVRFVYEPFNEQIGIAGIPRQFVYVRAGSSEEPLLARLTDDLLAGRARFHPTTIPDRRAGWQRQVRAVVGPRSNLEYKLRRYLPGGRRWLLKDPIASFASEWLHRRYRAATVVMVRHPAAVVQSYLRLGWSFGLAALASQPELVADHFLAEILRPDADVTRVEGAARLWAATYTVLGHYLDRNPGLLAVRHEDVSMQPVAVFADVFAHLGLPFDGVRRAHVEAVTGSHNPADPRSGEVHTLRRDSRADLGRWRSQLDPADVRTIRAITEPVAARWYSDLDW